MSPIRRRPVPGPPTRPTEPPEDPPKVVDRRHDGEHPAPHELFRGVCICPCPRCTDRPADDVTRCICPDCDTRACGARAGVRVNGDRVTRMGFYG